MESEPKMQFNFIIFSGRKFKTEFCKAETFMTKHPHTESIKINSSASKGEEISVFYIVQSYN